MVTILEKNFRIPPITLSSRILDKVLSFVTIDDSFLKILCFLVFFACFAFFVAKNNQTAFFKHPLEKR